MGNAVRREGIEAGTEKNTKIFTGEKGDGGGEYNNHSKKLDFDWYLGGGFF